MGKPLKDILRPVAFGLISIFCERVEHSADTQRAVTWTADHWDGCHVPLGYVADLKLSLRYTGNGVTPPKRRVGDGNKSMETMDDRSAHA
jgi:hypothetical protein